MVYLLGVTFLGIKIGKRIKGSADFFMPRRFGKGMMMMHAFGTGWWFHRHHLKTVFPVFGFNGYGYFVRPFIG